MFPQITKSERIIAFDLSEQHSAVLLGGIVSAGVIQYHFVLLVVNKVGGPALYVASEWSTWQPEGKLIPVLGTFFKGDHANIKDDPGLIDEHIFILKAVETARDYLDLKFVEPCIGELWGITGVMNKIGERRRELDPPAPLPEVKYFLPFFGFIGEIKEYVARQKPTDETDNLKQMIVDCNARFITVAASEGAPKRPVLQLVREVEIFDSFEDASTYAKQMALAQKIAFSVEQDSIEWRVNIATYDQPAAIQVASSSTANCGPTWIPSGEFWIGRHTTDGLIVVLNYCESKLRNSWWVYFLDIDDIRLCNSTAFCAQLSDIEITEFEVEIAILGYGTFLHKCRVVDANETESPQITQRKWFLEMFDKQFAPTTVGWGLSTSNSKLGHYLYSTYEDAVSRATERGSEYRVEAVNGGWVLKFGPIPVEDYYLEDRQEDESRFFLGIALAHALANKQREFALQLLERALDVDAFNDTVSSPLMVAALRGYSDICEKLLHLGASFHTEIAMPWEPREAETNQRVETIMSRALISNDWPTIEVITKVYVTAEWNWMRANMPKSDIPHWGFPRLVEAARYGMSALCAEMIGYGVNVNHQPSAFGAVSPIEAAFYNDKLQTCFVLIAMGADILILRSLDGYTDDLDAAFTLAAVPKHSTPKT